MKTTRHAMNPTGGDAPRHAPREAQRHRAAPLATRAGPEAGARSTPGSRTKHPQYAQAVSHNDEQASDSS